MFEYNNAKRMSERIIEILETIPGTEAYKYAPEEAKQLERKKEGTK